ncbi:NAD(P)H-binding protein [Mucilaginibacter segetis]|uniref:NAD(P)H-binding protein n=1 Tax=Mucilaginibacter segetis TaxID=2793071 RepID=A0A934PVS5_9SPHI|nr:NAD(P)H-binding protein [Mucilaginibacter segetis]MBK0379991.1 NAD(P)H-binding protein [Mucilaginibacter segetis]
MAYKGIIVGASGLIGGNLLETLLTSREYVEILLLVRSELEIKHEKLTQLVVDFNDLFKHSKEIKGHALFCCLGTTRKKTPNLQEYKKIDYSYPLELAKLAVKNGVEQYHLVSAIGADASSGNFYTQIKGETENAIKTTGVKSLHIYQPSLLTGDRKEYRATEKIATAIMKFVNPLLLGGLKKYRSIPALTVANAMYKKSLDSTPGIFTYTSDKIKKI